MAVRFNNRLSWFLPASCPHSVVVKYYGEHRHKIKVLDIPLGWVGGGGGWGGSGHK